MILAQSILIVGPAWVGDMVMSQTLYTLLQQNSRNLSIDVLAPQWSQPVLARMPQIRRGITLPIGHGEVKLRQRYRIAKQLQQQRYDQAIVLPNSFKSAFIPWAAKIQKRTGWLGEMRWGLLNDVRHLDKPQLPLMIQRFMALGLDKNQPLPTQHPTPKLITMEKNVESVLQKFQLHHQQPILGLCPGAEYGPAKRWPSEYFAAVANEKLSQGWQVWLFGSTKDQQVAAHIQQLSQQRCVDLTGKTHLGEAIDLMSLTTQVVTNDSGLMHIAAALDRQIVAIYGSSSTNFTPPLSHQVKTLKTQISCSPCFQRQCPYQHYQCLKDILPKQVLQALDELSSS